jgi:hypothetical protein
VLSFCNKFAIAAETYQNLQFATEHQDAIMKKKNQTAFYFSIINFIVDTL